MRNLAKRFKNQSIGILWLKCWVLDRDNWGPDQKYHVEPVGLFEYRSIPEEKMFGFKHFDC